jgi:hypothetical protein
MCDVFKKIKKERTTMKKKLTALCLSLALCLGLTTPAFALTQSEQKIAVGDETYTTVLEPLLVQQEDAPITLRLDTDVQLLNSAVVLGASDYGGLFGGETLTVTSHDVTIDLNGHTLTGYEDCAIIEVQSGYTLTITDSSADQSGKLVTQGTDTVVVDEGGKFVDARTDTTTEAVQDAGEASVPVPISDTSEETPVDTAAVNPFTDVAETSPFYSAILWAVDKGITKGTTATTFSPSATCTHNHILTFLWRSNGSPAATVQNPFENISVDTDFGKAALWAYEQELVADNHVAGLPGGATFPGSSACTRSQTVLYLWKLAGSPETEVSDKFTDVAADAEYAQAVAWAVEKGITTGTGDGTTFSPDNTCTRGQIVTFLYRAQA